jgi:peptidoglycan/LPS O-acetylase OafA/YrhL
VNRSFSIYLDFIRFGAACLVYLWHSNMRLIVHDILPASNYGHSSVIVFFVLSGFVIAYVTDTKEKTWVDYSASRLSRVYSVVLPTIVLTPLLDAVGRALYPDLYHWPFDRFALRLLGCLLLMNETWFISITFFSNVPYWSIALEAGYYVLFAMATFLPRGRRALGVLVVCALAGPKLVLLLPVWWSGVWLYRWSWLKQRSVGFGWCLAVIGAGAIVLTHAIDLYGAWARIFQQWVGPYLFEQLTFAQNVLGNYVLAALVFMQFAGMRIVAPTLAPFFKAIERPIRYLASYTFTLYLLHQPLLLFWGAIIRGDPNGHAYWWSVTAMTALSVWCLGSVTEHKRGRLTAAIRDLLKRAAARARFSI